MIPVPSYQVVQFLDWLQDRDVRLRLEGFDRDRLMRLAIEFLRVGGALRISPNLEFLLRLFQSCPMIQEPDILEQIAHFSGCGQCLEYIRQRGPDYIVDSLHPLLREFLAYAERSGFSAWVEEELRAEAGNVPFPRDEASENAESDRWLHSAISAVGPRLQEEFRRFLRECPGPLITRYESERRSGKRGRGHTPVGEQRQWAPQEEGAEPIPSGDSSDHAAHRLVASVEELLGGGYYDKLIASNHRLCSYLHFATDFPKDLAQSLEFLGWMLAQHPEVDVTGDIPSTQVVTLVQAFCEAKNYSNGDSFAKAVQKWMRGEAPSRVLERLRRFLWRSDSQRGRNSASPFKRYQSVRMHGMFLFLSSGEFPSFIEKYWRDLNALTGEHLDIYYSKEDLKSRVSGYETLAEFRSLKVSVTQLPALVLWEQNLDHARAITLGGLDHADVMEVMKHVVHRIGQADSLEQVEASSGEYVTSLLKQKLPGATEFIATKIIVNGGDNIMRDKYDISGQAGAVGPDSQARDITFNQMWRDQSQNINLPILAQELARLRSALRQEACSPEHDIAMGDVANAEIAAKDGDGPKVLEHLRAAGKWALSCAEKIGTGVVVAAIKTALGI